MSPLSFPQVHKTQMLITPTQRAQSEGGVRPDRAPQAPEPHDVRRGGRGDRSVRPNEGTGHARLWQDQSWHGGGEESWYVFCEPCRCVQ